MTDFWVEDDYSKFALECSRILELPLFVEISRSINPEVQANTYEAFYLFFMLIKAKQSRLKLRVRVRLI